MKYFYLSLVTAGAVILVISIVRYYRVMANLRSQAYGKRALKNRVYDVSYLLMAFYLIGYAYVSVSLVICSFTYEFLLVSVIFFLSSLFVMCLINVQKTMATEVTRQLSETIRSMICSIEAKDNCTKGHSERVLRLCSLIYEYLPVELKSVIAASKLKDAAMLHDIGKIGIPDGILNKPGTLTEEEYEIIRQHPKNGKTILEKTAYREICDMVLYHHERIDGKGYYNLPGSAVPLEAKIIAIADTFSNLYTDNLQGESRHFNEAMEKLRESAGTQLDAALVEAFLTIPAHEIKMASESAEW